MTLEQLKYRKALTGEEQLSRDEIDMLLDVEEEHFRRGNFDRVYPEVAILD
jgi:hypothetical protein